MRKLIVLSILAFSLGAQASGTRVGDGGHGVVCNGTWPILLDLYEAVHLYGRPTPMDFEEREVSTYLFEAQNRVASIMGSRHPSLNIFFEAHALRTLMRVVDGPIPRTLDVGPVRNLGAGCEVVQIAIRGPDYMSGILEVDRAFWKMTTNRERAMFFIHEGGHKWFGPEEHQSLSDTSALRQFVGLLYNTSSADPKSDAMIRKILTTGQPVLHERLMDSALR